VIEGETNMVDLVEAGELEVVKQNGTEARFVKSSATKRVIFRQGSMTLYCVNAIHQLGDNKVTAWGNILVQQGDSITLTGDTLIYDGNSKIAEIKGKEVVFRDDSVTLITQHAFYNRNTSLAWYNTGGKLIDDSTTLVSKKGYYNATNKLMSFKKDVVLKNEIKNYQLTADTLTYNTENKLAYFHSKTTITEQEKVLIAERGTYDTKSRKANFEQNASIETDEYILSGDMLDYNEKTKIGLAQKYVRIFTKKDTASVYGNFAEYFGQKQYSKVYGKAAMEKPFGTDTLVILADTLVSVNDTINKQKYVKAYYHVKIFSAQMQGVCDSLIYNHSDSSIHLFYAPAIWNEGNQITGDTIVAQLANNTIDKVFVNQNAFIISEDSLKNYNQIKGRNMVAQFEKNNDKSNIRRIDVNGNGQCIYFALDNDTLLLGINKVDCSNMIVMFADSNKLSTITFIKQPEAVFIPPHKIAEPEKKLKGFSWRMNEKPLPDTVWGLINDYKKHLPERLTQAKIAKNKDLVKDLINNSKMSGFKIQVIKDSLIFLNDSTNIEELKGWFYIDLIPKDPDILSKKDKNKGYEQIVFKVPIGYLKGTKYRYGVKLPTYPLLAIRAGQYLAEGDTNLWTDSINLK
jgi:lipopolysaccharide export system protein LptA